MNTCIVCKNPSKPNKAYPNLFTKYCSDTCKKNGTRGLPADVFQNLSNKDWLFDQRYTQKKAIETIAKELGISTSPVKRWIEKHNFQKVRYNESNATAKSFLYNREWLEEQHTNNKKSCQEIGDMLGVSKSLVSVWLEKHKIVANSSNSYPRKTVMVSNGCKEIIEWLKTIYGGEIVINARGVIGNQELDIYLPDKKLAIEYNGVWSHLYRPEENTEAKIKGPSYHLNKTIAAARRDILLLHIWSTSWEYKREIWESIIKTKLGIQSNSIFARKCKLIEIDTHTKNQFLEENHIQGKDRSLFKYGLYFQGELVSVMTFAKSRYNKKSQWELTRFAVKKNVSVIGGFSKLLSHFKRLHPGPIVSYADRMISNGNVYIRNGFELLVTNPPGYWYVKNGTEILEHRSKYRKSTLDKTSLKTEWEQMRERGYSKIFDCGTLTFILHK